MLGFGKISMSGFELGQPFLSANYATNFADWVYEANARWRAYLKASGAKKETRNRPEPPKLPGSPDTPKKDPYVDQAAKALWDMEGVILNGDTPSLGVLGEKEAAAATFLKSDMKETLADIFHRHELERGSPKEETALDTITDAVLKTDAGKGVQDLIEKIGNSETLKDIKEIIPKASKILSSDFVQDAKSPVLAGAADVFSETTEILEITDTFSSAISDVNNNQTGRGAGTLGNAILAKVLPVQMELAGKIIGSADKAAILTSYVAGELGGAPLTIEESKEIYKQSQLDLPQKHQFLRTLLGGPQE